MTERGLGTWHSTREHTLTAAEQSAERHLAESDAELTAELAKRYGDPSEEPPVPPVYVRYPVAAVRKAAATAPGAFAKKILRRGERELWRARHRAGVRPETIVHGEVRISIVSEPDESTAGNAMLAKSDITHLAIVRAGASVLVDGLAVAAEAAADSDVELVYGDSRRANGVPGRAPAPSRLRLREEDYLGPVVLVSVAALRRIGGFDARADGTHLLDVALRLGVDRARRVRAELGIGEPIDRPDGARAEAAAEAVRRNLRDAGIEASVTPRNGVRVVEYLVHGDPLVSVVIPTRGSAGEVAGRTRVFVVEAVRGVVERATWSNVEIVVVADDETPQTVIDELDAIAGERLVLVRWSEPFNFSAKMNRGAAVAAGEYLLVLNDDVEVVEPAWIERMLAVAQLEGVGEVGALLYFEDGSVQHLGHIHEGGGAGHVGFGLMPGAAAPLERLAVTREVSGVTAACAIVSAERFREVGGFSLEFPGNYNDVDLSLKIRSTGDSVVCIGGARLYHFESKTRDATVLPSEFQALRHRWSKLIQLDEYVRGPLPL